MMARLISRRENSSTFTLPPDVMNFFQGLWISLREFGESLDDTLIFGRIGVFLAKINAINKNQQGIQPG
jgi:hypothetical protein